MEHFTVPRSASSCPFIRPVHSNDSRRRPFVNVRAGASPVSRQSIVRLREVTMTKLRHVSTDVEFTYKNNNDYSLELTRWFLMPIGIWPRASTTTRVERFSSHAHIFTCSGLIAIIAVPCLLYVSLEEKDVQIKISIFGPLSHWFMGMINYWLLVAHGDDIRECVQHMEMDWRLVQKIEDQEVMMRQAKIGRFVSGFCAVFMQSGTFLFAIAKSLTTTIVVVGNETVSMHPMTCPIYTKFIDVRFSPANEIMVVVQLISCFVVNSVTVGACSLDAVFAMHAYGQLNMLFSWLNGLVVDTNNKRDQSAQQRLTIIVEHHLRVLSFISRLESLMQNICLVELLGCTMNMCLLAYYFITNWDMFDAPKTMSYVIIYLSMAFNIFIFCYIGEILTDQCKNVGEKVYMINWYELPHKTAVELILIIARSSNVIKMTAGKLFQLSIATFGDVIKTSVVYLNMLRTMTPSV
ncbi:PREDICTED: odorant receptor 82a-like [Dinoponera quadriceps]|uniref:Odorant receptor n=1 Tax=Dinoponera quadriceps TaxID=609295 RepID=A0A6P3Y1Y0_DINQU|nr:PREDICTED: odorant receptor 82a-like [Dinoponera quadriceps]